MSQKLQKISLIVIIVLLFLFLPLTGYSFYLNSQSNQVNKEKENVDKEFLFDGKLWFYNEKNELLGTYTCEHTYCDYGSSYENDSSYAIDSYVPEEQLYLPMVNDRYVFLKDTEEKDSHEVFLFDIKNNLSFKTNSYASVKNYQIGLKNNLFIVESKEHFGVLELNDLPVLKLSSTYDFIGIPKSQLEDDALLTDYFITLKNNEWMIIEQNEAKLTSGIEEEIVTFTGEHIITQDVNKNYHIKDYQNTNVLTEDFVNLHFVDRYLACTTKDEFYIYDLTRKEIISKIHTIVTSDVIKTEVNEKNEIVIHINDVITEKIVI